MLRRLRYVDGVPRVCGGNASSAYFRSFALDPVNVARTLQWRAELYEHGWGRLAPTCRRVCVTSLPSKIAMTQLPSAAASAYCVSSPHDDTNQVDGIAARRWNDLPAVWRMLLERLGCSTGSAFGALAVVGSDLRTVQETLLQLAAGADGETTVKSRCAAMVRASHSRGSSRDITAQAVAGYVRADGATSDVLVIAERRHHSRQCVRRASVCRGPASSTTRGFAR